MTSKKAVMYLVVFLSLQPGSILASESITSEPFEKVKNLFKHSQSAEKLFYKTPSIKGGEVINSAILIKPKHSSKDSGLLVLTYGTVGVASMCAPKWGVKNTDEVDFLNIPGYWDSVSYESIDHYLSKGIYVLAVNKEGQGNMDYPTNVSYGEPYANLKSVTDTINFSVLSVSQVLKDNFSGDWAIIGHSQGGQTVFSVAEYKKDYENNFKKNKIKITFKGGAALSPAMNISNLFEEHLKNITLFSNVLNINDGDSEMARIATLSINFIKSLQESGFNPDVRNIFGGNLENNYKEITTKYCVGEQMQFITNDISKWRFTHPSTPIFKYSGFNINRMINDKEVIKGMKEWSVTNKSIIGDILVVIGTKDEYVPFKSVISGVNEMRGNGNKIKLLTIEKADHQGYLRNRLYQKVVEDYITSLLVKKPSMSDASDKKR
ncbi:hypothetical protein [Serratia bockelmannii]|uniref:hypothetical protein n=1 Tax=Serratia bockelmannii TaxID=2703793 RepID=UPI002360CE2C|nr:hypothetical protein [Serratia bockelmannii]